MKIHVRSAGNPHAPVLRIRPGPQQFDSSGPTQFFEAPVEGRSRAFENPQAACNPGLRVSREKIGLRVRFIFLHEPRYFSCLRDYPRLSRSGGELCGFMLLEVIEKWLLVYLRVTLRIGR